MSSGSEFPMNSSRPYLLRALYEWIIDNGATPQILVDASDENLQIPDGIRTSDKVVLNIDPQAVRDLEIDTDYISFVARFSGVSHGVLVPVDAVLAVYARENGQGMMFPETGPAGVSENSGDKPTAVRGPKSVPDSASKPSSGDSTAQDDAGGRDPDRSRSGQDGSDKTRSDKKRKPNLKVVK